MIKIYPNPASDIITISTNIHKEAIIITNILGEILIEKSIESTSEIIDLSSLKKGIYFITINNKTEKIIKN